MRRQLVDFHGTRLNMRQDLYFPRGLSHPWGDNSSTATVLDSSRDKISTCQEDLVIHEVTICRLLWYSTQAETRSQSPKRTYSSMIWQLVDYYSTRPMKRQDLYFPRRNHHSRRQRLVDYYGTRTSSPFSKKKLFVHEMTYKSTTTVLEETTQDSQRQASRKGN